MAIHFRSNDPGRLLVALNQAIDNHHHNRQGQRIDTWRYVLHQQHYFYTHTSANWRDKAWLRADIEQGHLAFYILAFEGVRLTRDTYAYYAGHLIETFIRHFAGAYNLAQSTPNASGNDAQF
jgi:hypothetical protein